jgi:hypothetical protein
MSMAMIGVKIPLATRQLLEQQVKAEGSTISEFVRRLIEQEAARPLLNAAEVEHGQG